jgi:hypothetical protein
MVELLAFAILAVALAAPFVVPLMWGQIEQSSQDAARQSARAESSAFYWRHGLPLLGP